MGYLPVNGLNLYYEVYGELGTSTPPLLLIPGAFMSMSATFRKDGWHRGVFEAISGLTTTAFAGTPVETASSGVLEESPAARLVVLPAMSHIGISGEMEVLVPMVNAFLDDVPPKTPQLF